MATALNRFGCLALRYTCQIPSRRKTILSIAAPFRPRFRHTKPARRDKDRDGEDDGLGSQPYVFDVSSLTPKSRDYYNSLSPEQKAEYESSSQKLHELMSSPQVESELQGEVTKALSEIATETPQRATPPRKPWDFKKSFFSKGEEDPVGTGEAEKFKGDDITSLAHGELEQHREMRDYARIAAWDMPLLSKLAKPFSPPALDHPLRFRYTTYMGEEHPAAKKIVLEFCTRDLPDLTEAQRIKLIKLVGPRYNPEKDLVKMSCEMFETQAQNKRYLGDLVDTLMAEAKDSTDMFEDVPCDFRHHKYKPKNEFPEAWKITPGRKHQLEMNRQQQLLAEREKEEKGQITDGVQVIQAVLEAKPAEPAPAPSQVVASGKRKKRPQGTMGQRKNSARR